MREVVTLYFFDGLKYTEISQRLQVPTGPIKSRMNHALERLRTWAPTPA